MKTQNKQTKYNLENKEKKSKKRNNILAAAESKQCKCGECWRKKAKKIHNDNLCRKG